MDTGTVIQGTHREDDLIPAFAAELAERDLDGLREIEDIYANVFHYLANMPAHGPMSVMYDAPEDIREDAAYLAFEVLPDALDASAPDGFYFGTHPGDGSDIGYWPVEFLEV
jgi:hypothetical protein